MTRRGLSRRETRAFYDRFGAKQDSQAFYEDPALTELVAHSGLGEARAVVELGCGTGRLARRLLDPRAREDGGRIEHHRTVTVYGVASEVLILRRA